MQKFDESRFDAPAIAFIMNVIQLTAQREAGVQRLGGRQFRFLFDKDDAQSIHAHDLAIIELRPAGDHIEQRRFASAISADEANAFAVLDS
jgi:hypothetical protein